MLSLVWSMALVTRERESCVLPLPDGPDTSVTTPDCIPKFGMLGVPFFIVATVGICART